MVAAPGIDVSVVARLRSYLLAIHRRAEYAPLLALRKRSAVSNIIAVLNGERSEALGLVLEGRHATDGIEIE